MVKPVKRKLVRPAPGEPPPMPDSYIAWDGGDRPPVRADTFVEVWFRQGRASASPKRAEVWHWEHCGDPGDIIGWRPRQAIGGGLEEGSSVAGLPAHVAPQRRLHRRVLLERKTNDRR